MAGKLTAGNLKAAVAAAGKKATPHLHSNREADHDVNLAEADHDVNLADRVADLEEVVGILRQEFETYRQQIHDAGIRLPTQSEAETGRPSLKA